MTAPRPTPSAGSQPHASARPHQVPASLAQAERGAIVETLLTLGADAPTLCAGWDAHDLVAHLVAREARADLVAGVVAGRLPMAARHVEQVQDSYRSRDFADLVATFAAGPPVGLFWVPGANALLNGVEFAIHHEDLLRAQPEPTRCRVNDQDRREIRWQYEAMAYARLRHSPVGVAVHLSDGRRLIPRAGQPRVVVRIDALDLLLLVSGRAAHADYELDGTPTTVATFTDWLRTTNWAY